ncbi:histidine phosphatase family protein [Lapillicoccus jejuensis]|uniref:Putative phosphoglycerate mutase n=1 Tax=Lapillicoccus jejuensis TaxID=402171 RepID=A0A542DZS2_9MICO|nr:histidine phosphatase family protein [Lapillicoccus jejuensis]TQJ08592.1 putative phosphoglycerate mutase [Lapillicoccus jejuensis]
MRLLLVRHGETPNNVGMLLDTAVPGADLTDTGRDQARGLVARLADEPVDALFVSDLVRTHQTAAPYAAARGLTPQVRGGLREIQAGDWEMTGDPEEWKAYLEVIGRWFSGELDARVPGGETGAEVLQRYDAVVAEAADHACAMVVSHGAAIRAWCGLRAGNVDRDFVSRTRLGNTAVVALEGSPQTGWQVVTWDDTAVGGM